MTKKDSFPNGEKHTMIIQILKKLDQLEKTERLLHYWQNLPVGEDQVLKDLKQQHVENLHQKCKRLSKQIKKMFIVRKLNEILEELDYWENIEVGEDETARKELRDKEIANLNRACAILLEELSRVNSDRQDD